MGEFNDKNKVGPSVANKPNAHCVGESGNGIAAPPYTVECYEDDHDSTDPMDLLGNHLMPDEILVPANATSSEKFEYYLAILQSTGQQMDIKPGNTHILALRGVVIDKSGNIVQTGSAFRYQKALHGTGKLEDQHHFSDSNSARKSEGRKHDTRNNQVIKKLSTKENDKELKNKNNNTWNDIIVTLSIDENNTCSAKEHIGSVDPAKTGDSWGSAHLMDGTFEYGIGTHGTAIPDHVDEYKKLIANSKYDLGFFDIVKKGKGEPKDRYDSLIPIGNLKVLRDGVKKDRRKTYQDQSESKGFFTEKNIAQYNNKKESHSKKFHSPDIKTNGHMGGEDTSYSEGCWNLPIEDFIEVMALMKKQSELQKVNKEDFRVKFTLLDASKVGFKLVKNEIQEPKIEQRLDFSLPLDIMKYINDW